MEALLSLSFDNLSSYEVPKIRKGLRQVEGLLAQICLSQRPRHDRRRSMLSPTKLSQTDLSSPPKPEQPAPKELRQLPDDPAYREFFKLQEGFEWNVALRLVGALDRLMGRANDSDNDGCILMCLDLIQGTMLLHPPSRKLFGREVYMNHLLDLLEPINPPAIQSSTLLTLVVALLDAPANTRTFEALDGLLTVTSLFKSRTTAREVKLKLVEFLYFYLLPETPKPPSPSQTAINGGGPQGLHSRDSSQSQLSRPTSRDSLAVPGQRPQSRCGAEGGAVGGGGLMDERMKRRGSKAQIEVDSKTRSTEQKQAMLQKYLSSVEDLVRDLRESAPFGVGGS